MKSALTTGLLVFSLLALCARGVVAEEPKPDNQGSKFELNAKLVEQSRQAAVDHFAKISDPKQRPPKVLWGIVGLEELKVDLDSDESVLRLRLEALVLNQTPTMLETSQESK